MATTILTRADDLENGQGCGVGRTREIADQRAITMYIERRMGIDTRHDTPEHRQAKADIEADISNGSLILVRF